MKGGYLFAQDLLGEWLGGRNEARLGDACRSLERLSRERGDIAFTFNPSSVSRLLRQRGFRKIGLTGHGFDREPLYRREVHGGQAS